MKYKFLEDVSLADIAFEAEGKDEEEVFKAAALATTSTMINLSTLQLKKEKRVTLEAEKLDMLLYDWLSELLFIKDTEQLLFGDYDLRIKKNGSYVLTAVLHGDKISREKHELGNDVKAVTMHEFRLEQKGRKWIARVTIDI